MSRARAKEQITPKVILIRNEDNVHDCLQGLREQRQIIVNISSLEKSQRYRIIDFLSGYTYALNGSREKLEENIYMFSL